MMSFGITDLLSILGALGLFLYGMKMVSESLQKVAGRRLRYFLSSMTSTRLMGVLTGMLITAFIQSSSATTVLVVSFVNAGLLNLAQAIGVIMGANIGTTVTAWLIAIVNFKVKFSYMALPLVGLSFPFFFSKQSGRKSLGEFLLGFSIILLGLDFLKEIIPTIKQHYTILEFLQEYSQMGVFSTLLFVMLGAVLTILVQSSSATMAFTLVLGYCGIIDFPSAAAMVLGENVGTTVTTNLAAVVTNISAKRAARTHFLFNFVGVCWMIPVFPWFMEFVDNLLIWTSRHSVIAEDGDMQKVAQYVPIALAVFHTSFNAFNTLILVWFIPKMEQMVTRAFPDSDEKVRYRLRHIGLGTLSTAELSILQARKEIAVYGNRAYKMFGFIRELFIMASDPEVGKEDADFKILLERTFKYEDIIDRMEDEISLYLSQIAGGKLSKKGTHRISAMLRMVSEIENIGDALNNSACAISRMNSEKIGFSQYVVDKFVEMFNLVDSGFREMLNNLEKNLEKTTEEESFRLEHEMEEYYELLKKEHFQNLKSGAYSYRAGMTYMDLVTECMNIFDSFVNVAEALNHAREADEILD